nr:Flp pilus assembly protein CpaB [uncultured Noviherbaspirillum sp.]
MHTGRLFLSLGAALVAALAAVLLAAQWNAQTRLDTRKIAVAAVDIQPGTRLRADLLQLVDWPAGSTPHGASGIVAALEGRVTRSALLRGEPVQESRLAEPGATGGLSAMVAQGKRAMTVRVNDVVGVAGFALPGNFVDILVSTQEERRLSMSGEREQSISKLVLQRILVLAVAQEAGQGDTRPKVVNAVTLEVTPAQAEQLDLARSVGQLSLVLRNQVDQAPTRTSGATKRSLLQAPEPAAAAPVPTPRPVRVAAPPRECAQVLTGAGAVIQCF